MSYKKYPLLSRQNLKTIPINSRKSLVRTSDFGKPMKTGMDFSSFLDALPGVLAGADLKAFLHHLKQAREKGKPIILAMGAHPVKVGLNPLIIDLMSRGWISAVAINGAFMIHDFEIAFCGKTSEDVGESLHKGTFGNTEETGIFLNSAFKEGHSHGQGAGEAVGDYLMSSSFRYNKKSLLYHAYKLNIPVTVHPAIGTDFIHFHPNFDGSVVGELAERDFLLFSSVVSQLSGGGVYMNLGSAVIMPEVFLKAVAFCTGQGIEMKDFYTAVFDFNRHYRAFENVVKRPTANGGKGYYFVGHHEIMLPLLAALLLNT